jgi:hypothetical protein
MTPTASIWMVLIKFAYSGLITSFVFVLSSSCDVHILAWPIFRDTWKWASCQQLELNEPDDIAALWCGGQVSDVQSVLNWGQDTVYIEPQSLDLPDAAQCWTVEQKCDQQSLPVFKRMQKMRLVNRLDDCDLMWRNRAATSLWYCLKLSAL